MQGSESERQHRAHKCFKAVPIPEWDRVCMLYHRSGWMKTAFMTYSKSSSFIPSRKKELSDASHTRSTQFLEIKDNKNKDLHSHIW